MLPKCPTQYHFKCKFLLSSVLPSYLLERKIWLVIGWKLLFLNFCNVSKICFFFIFLGLFNNNNPIIIFLFLLYADLFGYWAINTYIQKCFSSTKAKVVQTLNLRFEIAGGGPFDCCDRPFKTLALTFWILI